MNLRDLEYLVALGDHGNYGRAAAACGVSQPTLSTQVKKLEAALGCALVERSGRQTMLTPAGEQIAGRARRMLGHGEAIRRIAEQARDPRSGSLRLGIFPTLAPYLLPHVVPQLRQDLPELDLLLVEERTPELLAGLRGGSLDAVVLAGPLTEPGLRVEPLFREDFVLAVPPGHPLAGQGPVGAEVLGRESVLLLEDGHCLRDQALDVCRSSGAVEMDGFRATSLETLRHMVAAGIGVTLMPRMAVERPGGPGGIEIVEFAAPAPHRDIVLAWRASSVQGDLMPELADLLRRVPEQLATPAV
ncbi:transcriptional regulator, LysR family [Kytococcus aerolatus]|uniref:Probable hydrogen peroxide-inducible genes activator n=1 Tax=Kytococcus aerolatus TaxID=592308 RepID=A0A212U670_9MICO|nr:LysR substrate-binding domain-containing protein [Kytococcus aerolatus]SNC73719.1 transcriptional regulator, LysR family [Kytococcus aerolatus]